MISQIKLVSAIARYLAKRGHPALNVRQLNAVIDAANLVMDAIGRPDAPAVPASGLAAWLMSDDTGISSLTMARRLAPLAGSTAAVRLPRSGEGHPRDPADLGRCLRLLDSAPELRPHLPRMAEASPAWAALVGVWDELESLHREERPTGRAPKLYRRMRELIEGAEEGTGRP